MRASTTPIENYEKILNLNLKEDLQKGEISDNQLYVIGLDRNGKLSIKSFDEEKQRTTWYFYISQQVYEADKKLLNLK